MIEPTFCSGLGKLASRHRSFIVGRRFHRHEVAGGAAMELDIALVMGGVHARVST